MNMIPKQQYRQKLRAQSIQNASAANSPDDKGSTKEK
jgi:hypothetical protein